MSAKDSQFIERALVHPWMFWVFFWKWPRILRQVCGEYDLVAKDRDAAKAAHEQAVAANEKVRKWIHVTHQLDATADLRAIWTAGKRLSILLVFFVATNAYGQAPPYLRNQWTTNANPLALKVISTNGVHAATNVWELDFTNTATVTVSAVSNANKVMVSFTGSGSGSSSLTNALLHAGPTNGSVDALILTAGDGVTLTTSGTNRIAAIDTNVVAEISDLVWTNYGAGAYTLSAMPGTVKVWTNGAISSFHTGTNSQAHITNGSFVAYGTQIENGTEQTNNSVYALQGPGLAFGFFSDNETGLPNITNTVRSTKAGIAVMQADGCRNVLTSAGEGGFAFSFMNDSTNVSIDGNGGGFVGAFGFAIGSTTLRANDGGWVGAQLLSSSDIFCIAQDGALLSADIGSSTNISAIVDGGSMAGWRVESSTNAALLVNQGSILATYLNGATNLDNTDVASAQNGSLAVGIVSGGERLWAQGSPTGVGAMSVGRDVTSTNNWTFGIHYTNTIPLSLAVGADGTTQFRAASNSVVIRSSTAPTVGQILTATDTDGTVGWSNAPAGGSGIASIYTNNVLAGGPGLTELGFTNTATVTVAATTNAGRVTMSFESATGSGIATNAGTGWFTTLYGLTNGPIDTNSIALTMNLPVNQTTNGLLINAPTNYPHTPLEIRWAESASGGQKKVSFSGGTSGSAQIMTLLMQDKSGFGNRINVNGANVGNEVQFQTSGANGIGSFGTTGFGISGSVLKLGGNSGLSVSAFNGNAHLGSGSGTLVISNGTAGSDLSLEIKGTAKITGAITNDTLTASTVLAADATKEIVSIANAAGVLTNDGAGVVGWLGLGSLGGGGDGAGIKVWTNQVAVGVGTNLDLIAGDNITILATNLTGAGGTNAISIGLTTSINTRQVGSAVLTNLAATRAVTNMTVTTITNVGVSLYTVPAGCTYIWVECIGGGGGGGGVDGAASQSAAGGGGGSGAYCSTNIESPAASYIVTVGTNGLGGAGTGGNAGTIGGTTLFTNILTALGGSGGAGKSSAAAVSITLGGAGALETATGRVYTGGNPGHNGICVSGTLAISGGGAGSHFGGGGAPQTAAVGANATGKGAGGSGAAVITNADRNGGNGSPGIIVIREFYQ